VRPADFSIGSTPTLTIADGRFVGVPERDDPASADPGPHRD
jgi:hypothetical protein